MLGQGSTQGLSRTGEWLGVRVQLPCLSVRAFAPVSVAWSQWIDYVNAPSKGQTLTPRPHSQFKNQRPQMGKGWVMLKINNVDLMCREYKLHVRGDVSHLETELISTEHQFSALTARLLKGKCFSSCSCGFKLRLARFFGCLGPLGAKVHLVRLTWRSRSCLVGALCSALHLSSEVTCSPWACFDFHCPVCTDTSGVLQHRDTSYVLA